MKSGRFERRARRASLGGLAVVALFSLMFQTACQRRRSAPNDNVEGPQVILVFKKDYLVESSKRTVEIGDDDVEGASLLVDGKDVGPLREEKGGARKVIERSYASLADRSTKLGLRFPTPCGTHLDVPLPAYEAKDTSDPRNLASKNTVAMKRGAGVVLPLPITLWVDDVGHEEAKIAFGALPVVGPVVDGDKPREKRPGRRMKLWGIDCASKHDVTVDGKVVGQASAAPDTKAFLIAAEPNVCYQRTVHRYADSHDTVGGGSSDSALPTGQVIPMPWSHFDYFLRGAPGAVAGSFSTKRSELDRLACGSAPANRNTKKARR